MLDKTISNLNLNMSYNDLVERVRIESVNSTQVMKITVKDTDPERARAIAADIVCLLYTSSGDRARKGRLPQV